MGALNVLKCLFIITIVTVSAKPIDIKEVLRNEDLVLSSQETFEVVNATKNSNNTVTRNTFGDGMRYNIFEVELDPNVREGTFTGRLKVEVLALTTEAREADVLFYVGDLDIKNVIFKFGNADHEMDVASFGVNDDDILEIEPGISSNRFEFIIDYTGDLQPAGTGLYAGSYGDE